MKPRGAGIRPRIYFSMHPSFCSSGTLFRYNVCLRTLPRDKDINNITIDPAMKYIGVVECISSGRMYIADITSLGYRPLVINLNMNDEFLLNYRRMLREDLEGKADFIDEGDDFDEFIGRLKEYDI